MTSFAVLGDWGIGKSSLLLKFAAISARPEHRFLPVSLSVGTDLIDYRRLAERLLDKVVNASEERSHSGRCWTEPVIHQSPAGKDAVGTLN